MTLIAPNETFPLERDPWFQAKLAQVPSMQAYHRPFAFEIPRATLEAGIVSVSVPPGEYRLLVDVPKLGLIVRSFRAAVSDAPQGIQIEANSGGIVRGTVADVPAVRDCRATLELYVFRADDEVKPPLGAWFLNGACPENALGIGHEIARLPLPGDRKFETPKLEPGNYKLQLRCGGAPRVTSKSLAVAGGSSVSVILAGSE